MTVAAKRFAHGACRRGFRAAKEIGEVVRIVPGDGLRDDLGGGRADASQRLQRPLGDPAAQLTGVHAGGHLGGTAERSHPVRWRTSPLELEGYLP
jgi:hypothetical protein